MIANWHTGEWIWFVVALLFTCISPVFIPFAIRARETRKDIGLALSFSAVCWVWVAIAAFNIAGWNLQWQPWS